MDGMVLDVLLRKHESIRKSLGISVPVPENSENIMETLLKGLLLRKKKTPSQQGLLPGMQDYLEPEKKRVAAEWDNVAEKEEKRSRTLFAQQSIKPEEVAEALTDSDEAGGCSQTVERFVAAGWQLLGGVKKTAVKDGQEIQSFSFDKASRAKFNALELPPDDAQFVFSLPVKRGQTYLGRTHPYVEQLAAWLAENSLDRLGENIISRSGVMRTSSVKTRATLLLCRFRFLISTSGELEHTNLAEECACLAFSGSPDKAEWLPETEISSLLSAIPDENVNSEQAASWIEKVESGMENLMPHLEEYQAERADALLKAQRKVRDAAKWKNLRYKVQAQGKPDILGIFVYLPVI